MRFNTLFCHPELREGSVRHSLQIYYRIIGIACLILFIFSACKKDRNEDLPTSPTTGTRMEFTLDSILLYAQQVYLWREAIPAYADFAPRTRYGHISPEIIAFQQELFDLSQLKLAPSGQPYEHSETKNTAKYSFLEQYSKGSSAASAAIDAADYAQLMDFWEQDDKKIAYLYINSFPELSTAKSQLDEAARAMADRSSNYLILDLRHHGGGYVKTAEYLANLIAPASLNGKTMYTEQFNLLLQSGSAHILKKQLYYDADGNTVPYNGRLATLADVDFSESKNTYSFNKQGALQSIRTIYFLVSDRTASAAEMLISVLKPYFKVKLVGRKTYGKPVGTFPIQIDRYNIYLTSFLIRNADGWSDYFDGMPVDITVTGNRIPDLGNPEEPLLAAALADITAQPATSKSLKLQASSESVRISEPDQYFKTDDYTIPVVKQDFKLKPF
ncbi:S41 family peptidase [Sphingobacterium pedocola]|uniref:Carboxyl-terminal protease n=1 Tax=Sphingobacterium pedocola TaxID=2082722 RepID=A0ABR9T7J9_9SPHI|nr:S41 family peptidase [Sphingobacterium pedocola]MBE8721301.1 carboxyl-terminal protease [Sphingobacterium pedocola]